LHQAAPRPRVHRADAVVVAVEQVVPLRIHRRIAVARAEHEALEEPGRVRQVPLGRAGVGHALHHRVLGRQRRGQRDAARAHRAVARGQRGYAGRGTRVGGGGKRGHAPSITAQSERWMTTRSRREAAARWPWRYSARMPVHAPLTPGDAAAAFLPFDGTLYLDCAARAPRLRSVHAAGLAALEADAAPWAQSFDAL